MGNDVTMEKGKRAANRVSRPCDIIRTVNSGLAPRHG